VEIYAGLMYIVISKERRIFLKLNSSIRALYRPKVENGFFRETESRLKIEYGVFNESWYSAYSAYAAGGQVRIRRILHGLDL
jgi:hypothetical protein